MSTQGQSSSTVEHHIEKMFEDYWKASFPTAPANKQSAMSHVAFAEYVIEQLKSH
jgi:HEPN domain-containing protein